MKSNRKYFLSISIAIISLMAIDFLTKTIATFCLNLNPENHIIFVKPFLPDLFFALAHNYNSSQDFKNPWGLSPIVLDIFFILTVLSFIWILVQKPLSNILKIGIIFYLSGFSNLIEFSLRGYATDFLMPNPSLFSNNIILVFNVADIFIVLGTLMFFIGVVHEQILHSKQKNLTKT